MTSLAMDLWDTVWSRPYHNYEKYHQVFWDLIRKKSHGKILDLGCGSSSCWKGQKVDLTGIDLSRFAIRESKKNVKGNFAVGNIEEFRSTGKFDTLVLSGVVNYFEDLTKIKETIKFFNPQTILITINVIDDFPNRHWDEKEIFKQFSDLGEFTASFHDKIGWFVEITRQEV